MQGRLLRLVLLVGVPTLALLVAIGFWLTGGRYITTENAYVRADIVQIAPEVAGRITEVLVRDHARVAAGAVLLRLDPAPFRLALEKAEAELEAARTQVELARATYQETQGEMAELEKRVAFLARQARRQEELASRGIAPTARMEETQVDAQVAQDRMNVLRQRLLNLQRLRPLQLKQEGNNLVPLRNKCGFRDNRHGKLPRVLGRAKNLNHIFPTRHEGKAVHQKRGLH
jgi:membrane fusion protein (multidrug efflux system)